ncbi:MAG: hypothetical protein KDE27_32930 [Planctomycetes bacterium]|nr:hypothetical protein [Planctomycetota bacterium]
MLPNKPLQQALARAAERPTRWLDRRQENPINRIKKLRETREEERRTRWFRDGLLCASVGAGAGLIWSIFFGTPWCIPIFAFVGGVLGAAFGDRALAWIPH